MQLKDRRTAVLLPSWPSLGTQEAIQGTAAETLNKPQEGTSYLPTQLASRHPVPHFRRLWEVLFLAFQPLFKVRIVLSHLSCKVSDIRNCAYGTEAGKTYLGAGGQSGKEQVSHWSPTWATYLTLLFLSNVLCRLHMF